jgi:DNA-binding PadR family transcriptional regulator
MGTKVMAKPKSRALTELEGAALTVIHRLKSCTPYRVRLDFLQSRSHEWSGSAGAVYPALRRLHARGLLKAQQTGEGRRSVNYALSKAGSEALARWLTDVECAAGSGLDPFRCRADLWRDLPEAEQDAFRQKVAGELEKKCADIAQLLKRGDAQEPDALTLELALHRTRLHWLKGAAR